MWRRNEVEEGQEYQVVLCQADSGRRSYALHLAQDDLQLPAEAVLVTQTVPMNLLLLRDVVSISETVMLTTGERFFTEAHGIWLTSSEAQALDASNGDWRAVPWLNGLEPVLSLR